MAGSCLAIRVACSKDSMRSGNSNGTGGVTAVDSAVLLFMFILSLSIYSNSLQTISGTDLRNLLFK